MSAHIKSAKNCLADNNSRGMNSMIEPFHWNLHNAIAALIKECEELKSANQTLEMRVAQLELQKKKT